MGVREDALRRHPEFPWLALDAPDSVARYLADTGWLLPDERVAEIQPAGEGNMNLVLRVRTSRRELVLKQSRPWVEKYDTIPAPWDRASSERSFYERASTLPGVGSRMPALLASDARARTLLLEWLPEARDFTGLYRGAMQIESGELRELAAFLSTLHRDTRADPPPRLANREMRALNHEHIYEIPLADEPALDLDSLEPGLSGVRDSLCRDETLRRLLRETGERYLADGPALVHGDYFPGSWLRCRGGVRVIDPEFGFYGEPELDLAIPLAHFALARLPAAVGAEWLERYVSAGGASPDPGLLAHFAGAEVIRRLIGVAQLPLPESAAGGSPRAALLRAGARAVREGRWEALYR